MDRDPEQIEVTYLHRFADVDNQDILEVGCGDGRLTWRYAEQARWVAAIDVEPDRLASAIATLPTSLENTVGFYHTHGETLPFASESFVGAILAWSM